MKNKKWFSLLEVLLSVVILWMFIWIVINIYLQIRWSDWKLINKRILTAEASDLIDVIHDAALDYTIDYEEYFNKSYSPSNIFTSYGNEWSLYYCTIVTNIVNTNVYGVYHGNFDTPQWFWYWCVQNLNHQKYLEYYFQHWDLNDFNELNSRYNSWSYKWMWPIAITENTWKDYLYLINWDWTERLYFRRVYSWDAEVDGNPWNNWKNEKLFKIQMLKLKWYDAWSSHNFASWWTYDWFIDTRACNSSLWYFCTWISVFGMDKLPLNADDWWVDITSDRVTVNDFRIDIYPVKDPYLAINETWYQIDPYAKISLTMNMFWELSDDEITISTTLSFKNSYRRFPIFEYTWYIPEEDF